MSDEVRILALEAQVKELRRQMVFVQHWHNTVDTPWWKRIWFVIQGYKPASLGTWYSAPWNRWAGDKYNGKF